jgi:hypothetical protein
MARLYPYGYSNGIYGPGAGGGEHITLAQLRAKKSFYKLHPEVQRRLVALFDHCIDAGHPLGFGTGWRVQPTSGGTFVRPGYSYHEGWYWDGQRWRQPDGVHDTNAYAIDTVPSPSWDYMNSIAHLYGMKHLAAFKNEKWHIQPLEIPTARRLSNGGMMLAPPPLNVFPLPVGPRPDPPGGDDVALVCKFDGDPAGTPLAVFSGYRWQRRPQADIDKLVFIGQANYGTGSKDAPPVLPREYAFIFGPEDK